MNKNNSFSLWRWNIMIMPDVAYLWVRGLFSFTVCFVWKFWQLQSRWINFQDLHLHPISSVIAYGLLLLWKTPLGFPWPQRCISLHTSRFIMRSKGCTEERWPKHWAQLFGNKNNALYRAFLKTLESCLFSALSHLHSIENLEQKGKN